VIIPEAAAPTEVVVQPALEPEASLETEAEPEPALASEPEPELASPTAAIAPDVVPWEAAPALIPQAVLLERVDVEEPPEDTAERDHALRMIAALEQWIDAIHVVRAQPLA